MVNTPCDAINVTNANMSRTLRIMTMLGMLQMLEILKSAHLLEYATDANYGKGPKDAKYTTEATEDATEARDAI